MASQVPRTDISLRLLDQLVEKPASLRQFLEENPSIHVNQIFNVTPHSVEGMEWTSSLLQRACSKHYTESVRWLLERGADPNLFRDDVEDINSIPPITLCVLHALTPKKRAPALANIEALVAHGAHVNYETECSSFPLECAASIVTHRSPRDSWALAEKLVECGARTKNLAPNMFSSPPEALSQELKRLERERQSTMQGALTFALQCAEVPRGCSSSDTDTSSGESTTISAADDAGASVCTTPERILPTLASPQIQPLSSFGSPMQAFKRAVTSSTMGPLSQLGFVPCTPPRTTLPTISSPPPPPPTACRTPRTTPRTVSVAPRANVVFNTPTAPRNIARKRTYTQIPWAPMLKHKAKRRRCTTTDESETASASPKSSDTLEFATPSPKFVTPTRKHAAERSVHTHTPKRRPLRKKQCTSATTTRSNGRSTDAPPTRSAVRVPADVQRVILDFALPIPHTPHRRERINVLMRMKSRRDCGAPLAQWFNTQRHTE